jgi:endoglycosylceramidase
MSMSAVRRVRGSLVAAALAASIGALPAAAGAAPAAPQGPLSHAGRWITDRSGRVVILHGVNMVYKRPPYTPSATGFGADDAAFLRRYGLNTVRLGVIYKAVEPQPGRYAAAYIRNVAATERLLADQGIFTMVDFHQDQYNERFEGEGWPDWAVYDDGLPTEPTPGFGPTYFVSPGLNQAFNNFWLNRPGPGGVGLQDRYAAAWGRVARAFVGRPYVMGYDLINEPWPGWQWPSCANPVGCQLFEQEFLAPMQAKAMRAIREVDRRNLIWYEPVSTTQAGPEYWVPNPTDDPRAGMSFHVYCVAAVVSFLPAFADLSCDQLDPIAMQNGVDRAEANGDTMLLSEFGATTNLVTIKRIVDLADRHMISWQWWHYCGCDDPTTAGPGDVQALVGDTRRAPRGGNLFHEKLDLVVRPYPQAVAGTPLRWSYDRETDRFRLSYSTERASGAGRFRRGLSDIFIPRLHYRRGYRVSASGAAILSAPNAQHLVLRSRPAARSVTVTVSPRPNTARR